MISRIGMEIKQTFFNTASWSSQEKRVAPGLIISNLNCVIGDNVLITTLSCISHGVVFTFLVLHGKTNHDTKSDHSKKKNQLHQQHGFVYLVFRYYC